MGVFRAIILMGLLSFVDADPPSQQNYGLCSQIYILYRYCTSQLSPTSTSLSQRPVRQPRTGKAGPRGPRGIVNYTAIDEKLAGKFSEWEAKMEEKFMTFKSSADKEVKEMKVAVENMTKAAMQENFTRLMISAEAKMDEMTTNLTNEENDLKKIIDGKFRRWKNQANREMRGMKSGIASKTNEWQELKDELVKQKVSLHSEMIMMKAGIANKTREYEESIRANFTRWGNSAELDMEEMKANLIGIGNRLTILATNNAFSSCEEAQLFFEGSRRVVKTSVNGRKMDFYCDMVTDGGNWTVFQRRVDGSVDFYRNWEEYASGFGNKNGEFWLGLETIHQLTQDGEYELRVDLTDWDGSTAYAKYRTFSIAGQSDGYRLSVGEYSGTAGDSMRYHNGQRFSAKDKDLGSWGGGNCATSFYAAWWFLDCGYSSLNGRYKERSRSHSGLYWYDWGGRQHYSLKSSEMKFRKK